MIFFLLVRCAHILKKHKGSRRPASWRNPSITQSKEEAIRQIRAIRDTLTSIEASSGAEAMYVEFAKIAKVESDCGSAERGGDLGSFGRGMVHTQN